MLFASTLSPDMLTNQWQEYDVWLPQMVLMILIWCVLYLTFYKKQLYFAQTEILKKKSIVFHIGSG